MANPTTNYGFVLPTPTDLVTDLPADFDVALQGVDTTLKALNPSTTLGDIEYRSSTANTNTRLAIGTTGQVLTVSGGVPAWATASAGGMTLISTTTLSGGTVSLTSIPQTYKNLMAVVREPSDTAAAFNLYYRVNNDSGANQYSSVGQRIIGTGSATQGGYGRGSEILTNQDYASSNKDNKSVIQWLDYTDSTSYKNGYLISSYFGQSDYNLEHRAICYWSTTAITQLNFISSSGSFNGGSVLLYGVS